MWMANLLLQFPDKAKTIEVSFIWDMLHRLFLLKERSVFAIRMSENDVQMDEVVVIGYGTAKRGNVTGAIAKVDAAKLEDRPAPNLASSLQGQLAGKYGQLMVRRDQNYRFVCAELLPLMRMPLLYM